MVLIIILLGRVRPATSLVFPKVRLKFAVEYTTFSTSGSFLRAASRIGTQLSAAVYDKALRIIDQSGIVDKPVGEEKKDTENDVNGKSGKDTPSKTGEKGEENAEDDSNASVGKIVNIMAIDTYDILEMIIIHNLTPPF